MPFNFISLFETTTVRYLFLFLSIFLLKFSLHSQSLPISEQAEISLLTVGPGDYLYDKFGHNAIRVNDPTYNRDIIFNYGTYDFSTPNFYTKFAQGKLLYSLDVRPYEEFHRNYVYQNRWIKQQVLNFEYDEKQAFFNFLLNNALPENKKYKYDFFYDNCATRIRDGIKTTFAEKVVFPNSYISDTKTFRELIGENVPANSWGSLGMDVAIGAVTDKEASPWEHQFLPFYTYDAVAEATIERDGKMTPLVLKTEQLYHNKPRTNNNRFFMSPLFVFGFIGLLILWITFKDYKKASRSRFLDGILFAITGSIGIVLMLLWFATDHSATANNYNLLWAFPFSILFCVVIGKKEPPSWIQRYVVFLILLLSLMTLHAITGVQRFAIGFVPLFVALAVRYFYVVFYLRQQHKQKLATGL